MQDQPADKWAHPPPWRIVMAFIGAPTVSAAGLACVAPLYVGLPDLAVRVWQTFIVFLVFGALPLTVVFGVPLYFFLRSRVRATLLSCSAAGAATLVLPWAFMTLTTFGAMDMEQSGQDVLIIHGHRTILGWLNLFQSLCEVTFFGLIAGALFWIIAAAGIPGPKQSI